MYFVWHLTRSSASLDEQVAWSKYSVWMSWSEQEDEEWWWKV